MNEQLINLLMKDGVDTELLNDVSCSINNDRSLALSEELKARIPTPECPYYGREIWEAAIAALLSGRNLLLSGPKATGKNILCENLAALFERRMAAALAVAEYKKAHGLPIFDAAREAVVLDKAAARIQ